MKHLIPAILLILCALETAYSDPVPKSERQSFLDSVCTAIHFYYPSDSSGIARTCTQLQSFLKEEQMGYGPFPLRYNYSSRPYRNYWAISFEDPAGDTVGIRHREYSYHAVPCSLEIDKKNLGWLKIRAQSDQHLIQDVDSVLEKARNTKALILDVRGYISHGSVDTLYAILGRFIEQPLAGFRYAKRKAGTESYDTVATTIQPRGPWAYSKPILVVYDYWWPGCGVSDLLESRPKTESHHMPLSFAGSFDRNGDVFGLQTQVILPHRFWVWMPTAVVLHPTKNIPEKQAGSGYSISDGGPYGEQIAKAKADAWEHLRQLIKQSK